MRIIKFKEDSLLVQINEQVASAVPCNIKGQHILKEIQLTEEEFEQLKAELADFCKGGMVAPPVWVMFITVDGKPPWTGQQESQIVVPG